MGEGPDSSMPDEPVLGPQGDEENRTPPTSEGNQESDAPTQESNVPAEASSQRQPVSRVARKLLEQRQQRQAEQAAKAAHKAAESETDAAATESNEAAPDEAKKPKRRPPQKPKRPFQRFGARAPKPFGSAEKTPPPVEEPSEPMPTPQRPVEPYRPPAVQPPQPVAVQPPQPPAEQEQAPPAPREEQEAPQVLAEAQEKPQTPAPVQETLSVAQPRRPVVTGRRLVRMLDEELGDELDAALADLSEKELFVGDALGGQEPVVQEQLQESEKRTVRVLSVRRDHVYVDLGGKSEGAVPAQQFDALPKVGDLIEVLVAGFDAATDQYTLRVPGAAQEVDWSSVKKGVVVQAVVNKVNKGGLEVTVNGIRGFMPAGQVDLEHIADLSVFVGQSLRCTVSEVDSESRNLVVSRRVLLEQERAEQAVETLASLAEGQVRDGVVKRLMDFGAFVDIGGVDGLLHVKEMSWLRVRHPADLLVPGQEVRVQVLHFDPQTQRISLGLKQLTESPWKRAAEDYAPGTTVTGTVTRIADFGAFVELEPAIEGLVHISELAGHRVRRVDEVVQVGQQVEVKVLDCDPESQRISLSLRQAAPPPEEEPEGDAPAEEAEEEPKPKRKTFSKPLKGGLGGSSGPLFG